MMRTRPLPQAQPTAQASAAIDTVLAAAVGAGASDLHLEPLADGYTLRHRVDGQLHDIRTLSLDAGKALVNQLMVAAKLLTYRRSSPQEGRLTVELAEATRLDLRLAVMPTTHGPRAVVRLPAELFQPRSLDKLDLPTATLAGLDRFIRASSGMLILCGPAGSGKTTTTYALLDAIIDHQPGLSVISLEDPVERDLPRVTQIQVEPFGELTFEKALRSILRQDPQVLAVGEIRDPQTAKIAVQAALSGHRLVTTLHAPNPEAAMVRLIEMGIEPYQAAGALSGIVSLRLIRQGSATEGYAGRLPLAEFAGVDEPVRAALMAQAGRTALRQAIVQQPGFVAMQDHARQRLADHQTDQAEIDRVLGQGG